MVSKFLVFFTTIIMNRTVARVIKKKTIITFLRILFAFFTYILAFISVKSFEMLSDKPNRDTRMTEPKRGMVTISGAVNARSFIIMSVKCIFLGSGLNSLSIALALLSVFCKISVSSKYMF